MEFEPVIGLEVHVQLKTKTKVFCGCSTEFGMPPNTQVCPVCLGFPGALPVLNSLALDHSIKVGIALHCNIQGFTKFDRKHYYYPDLPKNFQISQYDLPIAKDGFLDIQDNGSPKRIRIRRAHLEEDAGKLIHKQDYSLVDYNRTGQPLLEIVTEPDIQSPQQAYDYLRSLKSVIQYLGVSDCDMEKGTLRCDANISLRPKGSSGLGTKTELKNMNSFKAVKDALSYEIQRQSESLSEGETIVQETRLWDEKAQKSLPMRSKEEAKDYRYFPEPDLPPFVITDEKIEELKNSIPELPEQKKARFISQYGLTEYDATILVDSKSIADFAEDCIMGYPNKDKKQLVNWLIGPISSEANMKNTDISSLGLAPGDILELISFIDSSQISNLSAKAVLSQMVASGKKPSQIVKENNLIQISDESSLDKDIDEVIKENPKSVSDFRQGKENALMFLVGQVMKKTKGKANPKVLQDILKRRIQNA